VVKERSLFDAGNRRSGLWSGEGRSLFDVEGIGDRVLWVVRGDRCLILGKR
jgi:hypothetical protein